MKTTTKIRILSIFVMFFVFLASTTCKKEPEPKCDEIIISDDNWIISPKWLADTVNDLSFYPPIFPPQEISKLYPSVHSFVYENQDYLLLQRAFQSSFTSTFIIFTCQGDRILHADRNSLEIDPFTNFPIQGQDLWWDIFLEMVADRIKPNLIWIQSL